MKQKTENALWLLEVKFLIKTLTGTIITIITVYIFTSPVFIKPLYESEVIVYAPLTILSQQLNQQGIGFGNEKEIDWYIQTLKSNLLADSLNNRFRLMKNFRIDTGLHGSKSRFYSELGSRVRIEKTRYGSVSIKVRDINPQIAANMANTIVELGETVKKNMLNPNRLEAVNYAKSLFEQRKSDLAILQIKLDSLQKLLPSQQKEVDLLYHKTQKIYDLELPELVVRKDLYERKKKELDTPLPEAYIISFAVPAADPVRPKRGLFVVIAAGIYLLLVMVIEIIKRDIQSEDL